MRVPFATLAALFLITTVVALVVIAGLVVLGSRVRDAAKEDAKSAVVQGVLPGQPAKKPGQPGTLATAPVAQPPAAQQPAAPPAAPTELLSPLEQAARQALESVKKVEADPKVPRQQVIQLYEENVLGIKAYAKTKAAGDAHKAIARLQVGASGEEPAGEAATAKPMAQQNDPGTYLWWQVALAWSLVSLLALWILWKFVCIIVPILAAFCNAFGIKRWPGLLDLADQISDERQRAREARANSSSGFSKTSIYSMAGLGWYELRKQREAMEKQAEELRRQTRLMEERNQELRRKR